MGSRLVIRIAVVSIFLIHTQFVLLFSISSPVSALPNCAILSIRQKIVHHNEQLFLDLSSPVQYTTQTLRNPDRIVIDIEDSFLPDTHYQSIVDGVAIQSCRVSQYTPTQTRVVLDMKRGGTYKIKSFPNKTNFSKKNTLLVEVTPDESSQVMTFDADIPNDIFSESPQSTNSPLEASLTNTRPSSTPPISLSGTILTRLQTDTDHNNSRESGGNEQTQGLINRTILSAEFKNLITLSALSDYRYNGHRNRHETYDLNLFEAYLKYSKDRFFLKLGKQIRRWGKTDQYSPVDTLNPEDIREFLTLEYEDRKIPVWMADAVLKLAPFSIEAVYIPRFEETKLDYFGTDWGIYTHIKEDLRDNPAVPPNLNSYFQEITVHETNPNDNGFNGEVATRIFTTLSGWDLGATYHYTWEDTPHFQSFPVKGLTVSGAMTESDLLSSLDSAEITMESIEVTYLRSHIFGFEFETVLSDFGFRGEAARHSNHPFLTSNLTSVDKPVFYSIIGADYTGESNWYLNFQLSYSHISDFDDAILYFKRNTVALQGELNKEFFSSWVKATLHYYIAVDENQIYLSPRIEYSYIPNFDIVLGCHLFEGSPYSFMGRFDDNDQLFLDVTYHF